MKNETNNLFTKNNRKNSIDDLLKDLAKGEDVRKEIIVCVSNDYNSYFKVQEMVNENKIDQVSLEKREMNIKLECILNVVRDNIMKNLLKDEDEWPTLVEYSPIFKLPFSEQVNLLKLFTSGQCSPEICSFEHQMHIIDILQKAERASKQAIADDYNRSTRIIEIDNGPGEYPTILEIPTAVSGLR